MQRLLEQRQFYNRYLASPLFNPEALEKLSPDERAICFKALQEDQKKMSDECEEKMAKDHPLGNLIHFRSYLNKLARYATQMQEYIHDPNELKKISMKCIVEIRELLLDTDNSMREVMKKEALQLYEKRQAIFARYKSTSQLPVELRAGVDANDNYLITYNLSQKFPNFDSTQRDVWAEINNEVAELKAKNAEIGFFDPFRKRVRNNEKIAKLTELRLKVEDAKNNSTGLIALVKDPANQALFNSNRWSMLCKMGDERKHLPGAAP